MIWFKKYTIANASTIQSFHWEILSPTMQTVEVKERITAHFGDTKVTEGDIIDYMEKLIGEDVEVHGVLAVKYTNKDSDWVNCTFPEFQEFSQTYISEMRSASEA